LANSLTIEKIDAAYGAVRVLEDVSLNVNGGETVVLLGTNGNGKSTLMKCVMGIVRPRTGRIVVEIDGEKHDLVGRTTEQIVDLGIALVPEGRRLFTGMSVRENLEIGAYRGAAKAHREASLQRVIARFPMLGERLGQLAGTLSGGQQQMLAIGRALMAQPRLLLLDEPSLGLAPTIVMEMFRIIREVNQEGVAVLLVEQNVAMALDLARRAYVLEEGRIVAQGAPQDLASQPHIQRAYLGHQQ
jgi:branched-chain amino acid transport system ATP-binding protein